MLNKQELDRLGVEVNTLGSQKMYSYSVTGHGHFPVDMLRYDMAWPTEQLNTLDDPDKHTVKVAGIRPPTVERWNSFGWRVGPFHTWKG